MTAEARLKLERIMLLLSLLLAFVAAFVPTFIVD